MKLQVVVGSRSYCFADSAEELTEKPIHLVIDEHIELRDSEGDFVNMERGQHMAINMTIKDAEFLIGQLSSSIAEVKSILAEALATA